MKIRGVQTKQVSMAFITLSRNMRNAEDGSKTAKVAFDQLGVSQEYLRTHSTEDVLLAVSDAMGKMRDPAQRAALAQQLFGRGAQALVPVLAQGKQGVEDMLAAAQRYGAFLPNNVKTMAGAIEAQRAMNLAMDGMKISFTEAVLPVLVASATALMGFIAQIRSGQGVGGEFGRIISQAFGLVKTAVTAVVTEFANLFGLFQQNNPYVVALAGSITGVAVSLTAMSVALRAAAIAQAAFNLVADANPYVLLALAIAAFIGALVLLYLKVGAVRDFIRSAWNAKSGRPLRACGRRSPGSSPARSRRSRFSRRGSHDVFQIAFPIIRGIVQTRSQVIKTVIDDIRDPAHPRRSLRSSRTCSFPRSISSRVRSWISGKCSRRCGMASKAKSPPSSRSCSARSVPSCMPPAEFSTSRPTFPSSAGRSRAWATRRTPLVTRSTRCAGRCWDYHRKCRRRLRLESTSHRTLPGRRRRSRAVSAQRSKTCSAPALAISRARTSPGISLLSPATSPGRKRRSILR